MSLLTKAKLVKEAGISSLQFQRWKDDGDWSVKVDDSFRANLIRNGFRSTRGIARTTEGNQKLEMMMNEKLIEAQEFIGKGAQCENNADWDGAIANYKRVVALDVEHPLICYYGHNNLGYSLIQLGRFPEAEFHCQAAIAVNPHLHNAHKNLGLSLQGLGRFAEAAKSLATAAQLAPRDPRAWQHLCALIEANTEILDQSPELAELMAELRTIYKLNEAPIRH